jgi:hypothetical protein
MMRRHHPRRATMDTETQDELVTNIIPFINLAHNSRLLLDFAKSAARGGLTPEQRALVLEDLDRYLLGVRICVGLVREQLGPGVGALVADAAVPTIEADTVRKYV